jgi:hypothetical protein
MALLQRMQTSGMAPAMWPMALDLLQLLRCLSANSIHACQVAVPVAVLCLQKAPAFDSQAAWTARPQALCRSWGAPKTNDRLSGITRPGV